MHQVRHFALFCVIFAQCLIVIKAIYTAGLMYLAQCVKTDLFRPRARGGV